MADKKNGGRPDRAVKERAPASQPTSWRGEDNQDRSPNSRGPEKGDARRNPGERDQTQAGSRHTPDADERGDKRK